MVGAERFERKPHTGCTPRQTIEFDLPEQPWRKISQVAAPGLPLHFRNRLTYLRRIITVQGDDWNWIACSFASPV